MSEMSATLLRADGCDLDVVNSARVSFKKRKEVFDEKDARLLRYLAKHRHEIPFAHVGARFHFKAPLFVRSQLFKHKVGFVESEISRRYVTEAPEFWWPQKWRKAAENVKQGSSDEEVDLTKVYAFGGTGEWLSDYTVEELLLEVAERQLKLYEELTKAGVCAEQARMVLPQNMMTEWHWTGSLLGWARVWGLRTKPGAQLETQELVRQTDAPLMKAFPESWKVLKEANEDVRI